MKLRNYLPITISGIFATCYAILLSSSTAAEIVNGFQLTDLRIEREAIKSGGPPRDGIPSIDQPKFIPQEEANFLKDDDLVLSFTEGKVTRAYPLRILVWHEIVNETIAGRPIIVSYCPLCGTGMIFDRTVEGKARSFGVSGLLYQSDVLMYDRDTESLWSQIKMEAISGPLSGTKLEWFPSQQLTWSAWKEANPGGEVLSTDTGHKRNYTANAYGEYFRTPGTMFPVPKLRDELPQKEWVAGLIVDGEAVAFPLEKLKAHPKITLSIGESEILVNYDSHAELVTATRSNGGKIPVVNVFWFAWQAFYPQTKLWTP